MTGTGTIVVGLIVVLWLFVLAPLVLRGHKPVSRAGDALEDTRVVHQGGTAVAAKRRKPKFSAGDVHVHYDDDPEAEYVQAEPVVAAAGATGGDDTDTAETSSRGDSGEPDTVDTVIDTGEETGEETGKNTGAGRLIRGMFTRLGGRGTPDKTDDSPADPAGDTDGPADTTSAETTGTAAGSQAEEEEEDDSPRFTDADLTDDGSHYRYDDSFASPADLFHPDADYHPAADAAAALTREATGEQEADHDSATDGAAAAVDGVHGGIEHLSTEFGFKPTRLAVSDEDREFASRRAGRGGWDPETDARLQQARYRRRKNILLVISALFAGGLITGFMFGGNAWIIPLVTGVLTVVYLLALRRVAREENSRRQRRIRQLRRARLGVKNYSDAELGIPQRLRRPGAIVVELDDESPDFVDLAEAELPAPRAVDNRDGDERDRQRDGVIDLKNWSRPRRAM